MAMVMCRVSNKDTTVRLCYVFTVNDSPHPQASVTLGFLNSNFELGLYD